MLGKLGSGLFTIISINGSFFMRREREKVCGSGQKTTLLLELARQFGRKYIFCGIIGYELDCRDPGRNR
jgi:hypothetical protein